MHLKEIWRTLHLICTLKEFKIGKINKGENMRIQKSCAPATVQNVVHCPFNGAKVPFRCKNGTYKGALV